MSSPWINDLRFAMQAQVAVEITLYSGEHLFTGIRSVDEDTDTLTVWTPRYGGDVSFTRVGLNDIQTLTVTNVEYKVGPAES